MVRTAYCALVLVALALLAGRPVGDAASQPGLDSLADLMHGKSATRLFRPSPGAPLIRVYDPKNLLARFDSMSVLSGTLPDTASSAWKRLSADVGLMLRYDERLGTRGRLFVRIDGMWEMVGIDGPEDLHNLVMIR
jgi:hypothetical protein